MQEPYKLIIKSIESDSALISGYASVYNIADQHNDIILPGAFMPATAEAIKFLWQHDFSKPIGVICSLVDDCYGLKVEAVINRKVDAGKEAIELISQGAINGLSVGFNLHQVEHNDLGQRIVTKGELMEVSIVTFPANNQAKIYRILNDYKQPSLEEKKMVNQEEIHSKINSLEEKLDYVESFLGRPDLGHHYNITYKKEFTDYIRKGSQAGLMQKSFSANNEEGDVLLIPALYQRIISEISVRSPMRQLASVETISTNALDVIIEDGKFSSGWVGEAEAREESNTPKLQQKRIFVHELYAQPKASQTLIDDASIKIDNWLIERLRDSFVKTENDAFINGDGKKKPLGILNPNEKIEVIELEKKIEPSLFLKLINSLDEQYQANATFLMNRTTLAEVQKLTDQMGRFIWQQSLSEGLKQTIFGIPVVCCSDMPSFDKGGMLIAIADFKVAYKIVDRSGISLMRDPYTDKPFVKFYTVKRVGGDVVNPAAIKLAKFS